MTGGVPIYNTTLYRVYFRILWLFNFIGLDAFFCRKSLIFLVQLDQKQKRLIQVMFQSSDFGGTPCICCHLTQTDYFLWGHPFATVIYTMTRYGLYWKWCESFYKLSSVDRHLRCCWTGEMYLRNDGIHLQIEYIKEGHFKFSSTAILKYRTTKLKL